MALVWLIFAGSFLLWGINGRGTRQNTRLMLRLAITPLIIPFVVAATGYTVSLPFLGFHALWVHVSPLAALGALALVLALLVPPLRQIYAIQRLRRRYYHGRRP